MDGLQFPEKKTRVVATIGPASHTPAMLEKLVRAGMNVARINFAHGDLAGHRQVIADLRKVAAALATRVAIMGDLPGPKMRIGRLEEEPIQLERDQEFTLRTGEGVGNHTQAYMDFDGLANTVKPGDSIYLNDGYVQLKVVRVDGHSVETTVVVGGELRSHKGVNFPGIILGITAFTDQDREFLAFAAAEGLDAVSQSFVSTASDIEIVRQAAHALNYDPMIIAKIERAGAVSNIDAILAAADGMMVARGDMGVEIPIEEVAAVQKDIILRAKLAGKPVITATQMLESMVHYRRPTRAEVSDVTNAILDGSDAVMLSGETAVGDYPDEAVAMMGRIAHVAERIPASTMISATLQNALQGSSNSVEDHVSVSTYLTVETMAPDLIFAVTATGGTARRLARFHLPGWLVAFSPNEATCQRLQFVRGVYTVLAPAEHPPSWAAFVRQWVHDNGLDARLAVLSEGGGTLRASGERDLR